MTRFISCLTLSILTCMPTMAQDGTSAEGQLQSRSFLEGNPIWVYKYEHIPILINGVARSSDRWWGDVGKRHFSYYFLGGEKEIDGRTYRMMGEISSSDDKELCVSYWLPVREENGLVYTITKQLPGLVEYAYSDISDVGYRQQGSECILYDFSIPEGGKQTTSGNLGSKGSYELMDGTKIRIQETEWLDLYEMLGYIVDCSYGVMDPYAGMLIATNDHVYSHRLMAYYHGDKMLYKTDDLPEGRFEDITHFTTREEASEYVGYYKADPRHDEVMAYIQQLQRANATCVPEAIADESSSLYDLTGRRLTDAPKKGLYIKGGKKYVSQ